MKKRTKIEVLELLYDDKLISKDVADRASRINSGSCPFEALAAGGDLTPLGLELARCYERNAPPRDIVHVLVAVASESAQEAVKASQHLTKTLQLITVAL